MKILQIIKNEYAKPRRVIRRNMRINTWKKYVSKLNFRTSVNKIWQMIKQISGKVQRPRIEHLEKHGTIITDINEIGNTLVETIAHNSSAENNTEIFR